MKASPPSLRARRRRARAALSLLLAAIAACRGGPRARPVPEKPAPELAMELGAEAAAPPPAVLRIPPGEPVGLRIRAPATASAVEVLAYDAYGRLWARERASVPPSREKAVVLRVEIPTDGALGDEHELVVQVPGDALLEARRRLALRPARRPGRGFLRALFATDPRDFAASMGGGKALASLLREHGFDAVAFSTGRRPAGEIDAGWLRSSGLPFGLVDVVPTGWDNARLVAWTDWDGERRPGWDAMVRAAQAPGARPEDALRRVPCLRDPAYLDRCRARIRAVLTAFAPLRPAFVDLASEVSFGSYTRPLDLDFDPRTLDAFRRHLRHVYRSLSALNAAWGTFFRAWDDIVPATAAEVGRRIEEGIFPPLGAWTEFRAFMDGELASHLARLRGWAREIEPDVPIGASGIQKPASYGGYDPGRLADSLDFVLPYDVGGVVEILGSIAPRPALLDLRFGAEGDVWRALARGFEGEIVYWLEGLFEVRDGAGVPRDPAGVARLADEARALDGGFPRLWRGCTRVRSPVAIHMSQASVRAMWWLLPERPGPLDHEIETEIDLERIAWCRLLWDLGYDPVFLTTRAIESGALDPARFKALVLPLSIALSDGEVEAIERFCAGGGRLLADGLTGWMDGRGAVRRAPALEGLLGIVRRRLRFAPFHQVLGLLERDEYWGAALPDVQEYGRIVPFSAAARRLGPVALPPIERSVTPAAGAAFDYVGMAASEAEGVVDAGPCVIRSARGNWFLNARVLPYRYHFEASGEEGLRGRPTLRLTIPPEPRHDPPIRALIGRILADVGLRPRVKVVDPAERGTRPPVRAIVRERAGTVAVALLSSDPEAEGVARGAGEDLRLVFDTPRSWYLVREGKGLGRRRIVPIPRPGPSAEFVVGLPEAVAEIRAEAPRRVMPGGTIDAHVEIRSRAGSPCRAFHVVRRRVYLPDGKVATWHDRWFEVEGGRLADRIPIAWNAPAGAFTVGYREAVTGRAARLLVEVGGEGGQPPAP